MKAAAYSFPAILVFSSMRNDSAKVVHVNAKGRQPLCQNQKTLDIHDRTNLQIIVLLAAWLVQIVLHGQEFFHRSF